MQLDLDGHSYVYGTCGMHSRPALYNFLTAMMFYSTSNEPDIKVPYKGNVRAVMRLHNHVATFSGFIYVLLRFFYLQELKELQLGPSPDYMVRLDDDNYFKWKADIEGPVRFS